MRGEKNSARRLSGAKPYGIERLLLHGREQKDESRDVGEGTGEKEQHGGDQREGWARQVLLTFAAAGGGAPQRDDSRDRLLASGQYESEADDPPEGNKEQRYPPVSRRTDPDEDRDLDDAEQDCADGQQPCRKGTREASVVHHAPFFTSERACERRW